VAVEAVVVVVAAVLRCFIGPALLQLLERQRRSLLAQAVLVARLAGHPARREATQLLLGPSPILLSRLKTVVAVRAVKALQLQQAVEVVAYRLLAELRLGLLLALRAALVALTEAERESGATAQSLVRARVEVVVPL
jgi:hypothetical protein